MLRRIPAFFAFLVFSMTLVAQDAGTVEGTITWNDGRSGEYTIFIPMTSVTGYPADLANFRNSIYYLNEDEEKTYISPSGGLASLEFDLKGQHYYIESKEWMDIERYMLVQIDGKMQLLKYHYMKVNDDGPDFRKIKDFVCIPARDGMEATEVIRLGFKKKMIEFFDDYPEMAKKIKDKEFKYGDLEEMVKYFNETYG